MLLTILLFIVALAGGIFLLALVSEAFAREVSRVVEAAFDFIEYRDALRRARRSERGPQGGRAALFGLRVG